MAGRRHEKPIKRVNPGGAEVWVARWTNRHGERRSAGTFKLKGPCRTPAEDGRCCAQHAIDKAYDTDAGPRRGVVTVGTYAETWTTKRPRSARTNATNDHRLSRVLDVELDGVRLRDIPYGELRRRHVHDLVDVLLRKQGRSRAGAQNLLLTLSAMTTDAVEDEHAETNVFLGVKVRANDPRITKAPRELRVCSWEDMHRLAAAAGAARTTGAEVGAARARADAMNAWRAAYAEAMVRVLSDCGLRLGELLPLRRTDLVGAGACSEQVGTRDGSRSCSVTGAHLHVRRTAHEGQILEGTKTTHGLPVGGRVVPVPGELERMLRGLPARLDTTLLFPTPGGDLWGERNFYRRVWDPGREGSGVAATPHVFRHSWISLLQAAGIDHADLAEMAGHTVETMHGRYSHALGRSFDAAAAAVGA